LRSAEKAAIVSFFNIIGYTLKFNKERTNHIKEFYNNCQAAFSAERSHYCPFA